jgi:hypothetical protein
VTSIFATPIGKVDASNILSSLYLQALCRWPSARPDDIVTLTYFDKIKELHQGAGPEELAGFLVEREPWDRGIQTNWDNQSRLLNFMNQLTAIDECVTFFRPSGGSSVPRKSLLGFELAQPWFHCPCPD